MKTDRLLAVGLLAVTAITASAATTVDSFGSGLNSFNVSFVDIGNAGNGNDLGAGGGTYSSPFGGVAYSYRMGMTEVPQTWIDKAANLGLTNMPAGAWAGLQPAANITWFQAAAFVNWLNTSTGHQAAYNLNVGATALTLWSSAQAWQAGGQNLYRNKDAYYFLPSEDEWYKAAYHKNDGVTANYWDYATGSNGIPGLTAGGTSPGTAVYDGAGSAPAAVNNAGGPSAYGTMGQGGNVSEWQESAMDAPNSSSSQLRAFRGGWWQTNASYLSPPSRGGSPPTGSFNYIGLRVAAVTAETPEPASGTLFGLGALLLGTRRRSRG